MYYQRVFLGQKNVMSLVTFDRHGNYTIDSRYVAVAYNTTITPIWKRRHSDEVANIVCCFALLQLHLLGQRGQPYRP